MDKKIIQILEYAIMAPSGDNSQPWRFGLEGSVLEVHNMPDKDNPYLNFKQGGSFIAHGALIRNIEIASRQFNLACDISFFPDHMNPDLVAKISFTNDVKAEISPLFDSIKKRETNRRPYKRKFLSSEDSRILNEAGYFDGVCLRFITDDEKRKRAGRAGSIAEVIILENDLLHEYLFRDVMWSEKQEKEERHGLYIRTMEFNPVQKLLFKLASYKPIMRLAKKIRFPYFIAKQDALLYASGSAIGLLSLTEESPLNFVKLGMKMEDIWLKITSQGMAFQPITATLFLGFKILNSANDRTLCDLHKDMATKAYNEIISVFELKKGELPFIMFRIGYVKKSSARSSRKNPVVDVKI